MIRPALLRGVDATRIAPKLWMGSYPPTGRTLADAGFRVLVLCTLDMEGPHESVDFPGVILLRCPLDDGYLGEVQRKQTHAAAALVVRYLKRNMRVLVCCAQGRNRSGLVVSLALHALTGMNGKKAVALVRRLRGVNLPEGYEALMNPHYRTHLERLETRK